MCFCLGGGLSLDPPGLADELKADCSILGEVAVEVHGCLACGVSGVSIDPRRVADEGIVKWFSFAPGMPDRLVSFHPSEPCLVKNLPVSRKGTR
jgi:hypothetical protein